MGAEAAERAAAVERFRREDYIRTRHDPHFSNWQVLIGANDWEEYLDGKEGVARYRLHNLPKRASPGLYELGIAVCVGDLGRGVGKLNPKRIVVAYLGQADNVRTRLQQYGRSGAHLGRVESFQNQKGDGCFKDIFSKGHSIAFRWAPMENKADAQKTESELLHTFDYAWNKGCNAARRPEDILNKIDELVSGRSSLLTNIVKILPYRQKRVGIKIKTSTPLSLDHEFNTQVDQKLNNFLSRIFKFSRSQPRPVSNECDSDTTNKEDAVICGVILSDGSICVKSPVKARKRCAEHKGMKTKELILRKWNASSIAPSDKETERSFGEQDSIYNPVKLQSVSVDLLESEEMFHPICGFLFEDGSPCTRHPTTKGSKRCDEHKGRKISNSKSETAKDRIFQYTNDTASESCIEKNASELCISEVDGYGQNHCNSSICGAATRNGSFCRRTVKGNRRCWQH